MRVGHLLRFAMVLAALLGACSNAGTSASKTPAPPPQQAPTVDTAHPAQAAPATTTAAQPAAAPASAAQSTTATSESASVDAAVIAAESWLALVDSAKYDESWRTAAALFQHGVSEGDWSTVASKTLSPLGKLRSRHLQSTAYQTKLPGAPDGKYVVIRFDATFENKASAVETVTPMLGDDGAWKVAGYFVK